MNMESRLSIHNRQQQEKIGRTGISINFVDHLVTNTFTTKCIKTHSLIIKQFRGLPKTIWNWNSKWYSETSSAFWVEAGDMKVILLSLLHLLATEFCKHICDWQFPEIILCVLLDPKSILCKSELWRSIMHLSEFPPSFAGLKFLTDSNWWWRYEEVTLYFITVHPNLFWVTSTYSLQPLKFLLSSFSCVFWLLGQQFKLMPV